MNDLMELNKETALRLWTQQFGSQQKAFDFSGREIARAAYNNRGSKFGWNVDHILPQSRGGKTADHNLVCCHILTNDEKADKFPCFKANGKEYEIQKRQNHYEIISKVAESNIDNSQLKKSKSINFYDAAQGVEYWNSCQEKEDQIFVGYVKVLVCENTARFPRQFNVAVGDLALNDFIGRYKRFLCEIFNKDYVIVEKRDERRLSYVFTIIDDSFKFKEETEELLNKCVLLNTYSNYFITQNYCGSISIACGIKCYQTQHEMAQKIKKDIINADIPRSCAVTIINGDIPRSCALTIDERVVINTSAEEQIQLSSRSQDFYEYDYIFKKLKEDLKKQN